MVKYIYYFQGEIILKRINTSEIKNAAKNLVAGEEILLSGVVYTARDAAHKRIMKMMENGEKLPFDIDGAVIYYASPTQAKHGYAVGSCGPTTSIRMDVFTPKLLDMGLGATIGKGNRGDEVEDAIIRNKSVYLCAIGGAGALACARIKSSKVIAFDDLGCESVKEMVFEDFPLFVAIDSNGGNIFKRRSK